MFKINNAIHTNLGISTKRDKELESITSVIGNNSNNESDFLLSLRDQIDLTLIEKLYVAAQFGRLYRGEK